MNHQNSTAKRVVDQIGFALTSDQIQLTESDAVRLALQLEISADDSVSPLFHSQVLQAIFFVPRVPISQFPRYRQGNVTLLTLYSLVVFLILGL